MDNNSPLFLAHQNGRKAEKLLKKKAFDEAIECHLNASTLLQEAMTLTSFAITLESLQLQKNYHLSQTNIIKVQKRQYTLKMQVAESRRKKRMDKRKLQDTNPKDKELKMAVLKKMEQADALISQLSQKQEIPGYTDESGKQDIAGFTEAKNEKTVVEELKVVNLELRSVMNKLFNELESSRKEVETLRSRLKLYEEDSLPALAPLELPNFDFSSL